FPIPFTGFFIALASAGATHGPWAETTATPAHTSSEIAATAMLSDFPNALMTPPLTFKLVPHYGRDDVHKGESFNTPETNEVKQLFGARAPPRASSAPRDRRRRRRAASVPPRVGPTARTAHRSPGGSGSRRRARRGSRPRRGARPTRVGRR